MSTPSDQARAFFEKYVECFDAPDWPAFAGLYCEPAVGVRADGRIAVFETRASVAEFFARVAATYRQEGYVRFSFSNLSAFSVGGESMLASLTWHLLRQDGSEMRRWNQSYQLLADDGAWKVLSSTFHRPPAG